MIRIIRGANDTSLVVRITPRAPLKESVRLDFHRACASEIERDLLEAELDALIAWSMEQIRTVSYNAGWRDAKSHKKAKRDWFATATDVMDWERTLNQE